ncbi:MAG: SPFH domain-containing protein [Eubacteriales bacterium]|nr:SPFH domain-containing protein [Eubacteriales bacterium]
MQEKVLKARPGLPVLITSITLYLLALGATIGGGLLLEAGNNVVGGILMAVGIVWLVVGFIPFLGLKILGPKEAYVFTLFGKYTGTIREAGFYFVHPFSTAVNPTGKTKLGQSGDVNRQASKVTLSTEGGNVEIPKKKISLKVMTLNNSKQKVNDVLGNPVEIGIAVMWRVVDTAQAVFEVDNYMEYLSLQCDSAVRNVVRIYPYDVAEDVDTTGDGEPDEGSLRGSSLLVADRIKSELQEKVEFAGLEILEARITYLAYAPEIAAAMLQRQQAQAVVDARKLIVEGAVGMVKMAMDRLEEEEIVKLDEERKAALVSNMLVILSGSREAQPVINTGSNYNDFR